MDLAKFTEVERLLLESLHEFGPLELTDKNLPSVAASLGTNGKVLTMAKNKLVRQQLIIPADNKLHITAAGKALFAPPVEREVIPTPQVAKATSRSAPPNVARPVATTSQTVAPWWQFWKRSA